MNLIMYLTMLAMYIVVGTLIAIISRKLGIRTVQDYYVAGYRLSGFLASMTYAATTYSAFMMIGLVGLSYATGVGALGFELAYFIATLTFLALFSKKVWSMARKRKWISPAEMISDLYGSKALGIIVSLIYLVALVPYISAQLIGIGRLLEGIGGYEYYMYGVLLGSIIIFAWTFIAGIWSIATTDTYQGLWMIIASLAYIAWLYLIQYPSANVNLAEVFRELGSKKLLGLSDFWALHVFLAFTIPWVFFAVTNPQVVQRLYMPRDEKALSKMISLFALFGFSYTVIVTLVGLGARGLTEAGVLDYIEVRDLVTPILLGKMHSALAAFIFTSIVAAAVSTADSIILTVASSMSKDLYMKLSRRPSERKALTIGYLTIALLVIITASIALTKPGFIVEMSVLSSVILLSLAPITIAAWITSRVHSKEMKLAAIASLILGTIASLYVAIIYGPKKAFIMTWYGLPISFWILMVTTILVLISYLVAKIKT